MSRFTLGLLIGLLLLSLVGCSLVLDDDAYPPVVVADEETTETMFAVTAPLEPGSYSWTVWARDANGIVVAELVSQFIVK